MGSENNNKRWSGDDDMIIAEAVLGAIREGSIQADAFKHAGDIIGRTGASCALRWNTAVKQQYKEAVQLAKSQQIRQRGSRIDPYEIKPLNKLITVEDVTSFIVTVQKENDELRNEIDSLKTKLETMDAKYKQTHDDYQALIKIMDRARRLAFLTDDDDESEKPKFKMDRNGNLERLN